MTMEMATLSLYDFFFFFFGWNEKKWMEKKREREKKDLWSRLELQPGSKGVPTTSALAASLVPVGGVTNRDQTSLLVPVGRLGTKGGSFSPGLAVLVEKSGQ